MDLSLPSEALNWQRRAKAFAEEHLFPHEVELELHGSLPPATLDRLRRAVKEHGLNGVNHAKDVGGQGCSQLELTVIGEELGKATGALWAIVPHPAVALKHGTPEQIDAYLRPSCAMERRACVAVTEPQAGSDPRMIGTRADRRDGRFVLNGEKWFVTSGDVADYIIVHANVDGDPDKPTLFLVDKALPGVRIAREPKFTHTYVFGHPEFLFEDVEVGEDRVLGPIGGGLELTKDWFVEARLQIAASTLGAAIRAFELANAWASERRNSAARSVISRLSSSCSPTWRSRSWRRRASSTGYPGKSTARPIASWFTREPARSSSRLPRWPAACSTRPSRFLAAAAICGRMRSNG